MSRRSQEVGRFGVLAAAGVCLGMQTAAANSICVTCDGPPAVYSCSYAPSEDGNGPPRSDRALQFMCIQDVARQYQHASCSVRRHELDACNGQIHMLSPFALRTAPPGTNKRIGAETSRSSEVAREKTKEPKTVLEMAKRTARSTKKQIDKSAKTVSKAARSTWRCISSLFSKC